MPDDSDEIRDLVAAAKRGDTMAQEALLRQHLAELRTFVRLRSDSQLRLRESESDLVQSICREVLADLDGFEYRNPSGFRGWLFRVALSKIREKGRFHRADQRTRRREAGSLDAPATPIRPADPSPTASQAAIHRESEEQFEQAFDTLSPEHREIILLSRVMRLSHREIAAELGRSEVATRSLLSRALVALSEALAIAKPGDS